MNIDYKIASESSIILYFGSSIDPHVSQQVQKAYKALKKANIEAFYEIIPSYASLLISFDCLHYDAHSICEITEQIIASAQDIVTSTTSVITIPVYYGNEVGWDLEILAEEKKLCVEEIIALHASQTYSVYAIGFAPGFAYMGQIDEKLSTSRLANPRKVVPKGSVAIADRQTAIYPLQSPGGWKILGRTPQAMFDVSYDGLSLLHVGDNVHFEPISKTQFLALGGIL